MLKGRTSILEVRGLFSDRKFAIVYLRASKYLSYRLFEVMDTKLSVTVAYLVLGYLRLILKYEDILASYKLLATIDEERAWRLLNLEVGMFLISSSFKQHT